MTDSGAQQLARLFADVRSQRRAALLPYLTAGLPDADTSVALFEAMAEAGADGFEIGIPYSDPLMDGPVIAEAGARSLAAGTTIATALEITRKVSRSTGKPILLMTYTNPVLHHGIDAFMNGRRRKRGRRRDHRRSPGRGISTVPGGRSACRARNGAVRSADDERPSARAHRVGSARLHLRRCFVGGDGGADHVVRPGAPPQPTDPFDLGCSTGDGRRHIDAGSGRCSGWRRRRHHRGECARSACPRRPRSRPKRSRRSPQPSAILLVPLRD